jgi:hypothetical protein
MQQLDANNIQLSGRVEGNFYPSEQAEILRNVILKSPFEINGGIFANNLKNLGSGIVFGLVLVTSEITISPPLFGQSPVKFLSGINATNSIAIIESSNLVKETVVSNLNQASIIVQGDVISDSIKLNNALVLGNVRAREASIVNSVIVGSIFTEETLKIENSLFMALSD